MKKNIKSLLLCMCLLTTSSRAEGEAQAASVFSRFVASFIQGSSQFTINSASFLYQVAINNPQTTAAIVSLAASGGYGLYKIYNSEMMKKFREVMSELTEIKTQINNIKKEIVEVVKKECSDLKTDVKESLVQESGKVCAKIKKNRTHIRDVRADISENAQLQERNHIETNQKLDYINGVLEQKTEQNKEVLDQVVTNQKDLLSSSVIINKTVEEVAGDVGEISCQQKKDSELLNSLHIKIDEQTSKIDEQINKVQEIWNAVVADQSLELPEVMNNDLRERLNNLQPTNDSKKKMVSIAEVSVEQMMPQIQQMVVAQVAQQYQSLGSAGLSRTLSTSAISQVTKEDLLITVRQVFAEQKEERSLDIILSSLDQVPEMINNMSNLYKKINLLEKKTCFLQGLTHSMFQGMCYVVYEVPESRNKNKKTLCLTQNGE